MLDKIKAQLISTLKGRSKFKIEYNCAAEWYGSTYGGFYLNPTTLNNKAIVYSFGIGQDITFDEELIKRHNCKVFGFDPTPKSIQWINSREIPENFKFYEFGIGKKTEKVYFNLPKKDSHVSGSIYITDNVTQSKKVEVQMKSFKDIIRQLNHNTIDILKMDIEGSEYEVIPEILQCEISIKQILLELHERFFVDGKSRTKYLITELQKYGYKLFAKSWSNEELSFIKTN